jgi:hypothetical protein
VDHETATPVRAVPLAATFAAPTQAVVGVADGEILAANAARRGASFVVISPTGEYVSFAADQAAVLGRGITLFAPGGVWEMDERTFTRGSIHAIASVAGVVVAIQEQT